MSIALIDYGAGNLPSVERALRRLGADTLLASTPDAVRAAKAIVLPGVGHFAALMRTLEERQLLAPLRNALENGVPFLGICVGLQALYEGSDEAPDLSGLALLPGRVQPLPKTAKLPHMGWNQLFMVRGAALLRGIDPGAYFYFAHSFAAVTAAAHTTAFCNHGVRFVAAIERGNLHGVQFHPEKSGEAGMQVLRNFVELAQ